MITIQDTIFMGTAAPASGGGGSITVDQTYDATSANAQSGTAVAEAVATKQNVIDANNKLSASYVSGLATVATTGDYADLTNKPTIPTVIPADNSTITENASNQLQTVGIVNQNTASGAISPLKVWNGTEQEWNTGGSQTWYNWKTPTYSLKGNLFDSPSFMFPVAVSDTYAVAVCGQGFNIASGEYFVFWDNMVAFPTNFNGTAIAYGNGVFVCLSGDGKIAYSATPTDENSWTVVSLPNGTYDSGIRYINNRFVVFGSDIATSADGVTWTAATMPSDVSSINDIAYGNGIYVAYGTDSSSHKLVATSADISTWNNAVSVPTTFYRIAFGNGVFCAVNGSRTQASYYSTNGTTWTQNNLSLPCNDICFANGMFFVKSGASNGNAATSVDAITWNTIRWIESVPVIALATNGKVFVGVSMNNESISVRFGESCYTSEASPTTASTVYSEPSVTSALTITAVGTGTITLSDTNTYNYNESGNQTTTTSVGQAHPDYLCNIDGVGVKIGTTDVANLASYTAGTNIAINNGVISATDTTYSAFGGATSSVAGSTGLVPAPATGDREKYLKGDGTWATVSGLQNVATKSSSLSIAEAITGTGSVNFGTMYNPSSSNRYDSTVSIGIGTYTGGIGDVVIGSSARAFGSYSTAIGISAYTRQNYSIQLGFGENNEAKSFYVGFYDTNSSLRNNYKLLDGTTGKIPNDRINGVSGSFTSQDGKTVTVTNGVITSIVGTSNVNLTFTVTDEDRVESLIVNGTTYTSNDFNHDALTLQFPSGTSITWSITTYKVEASPSQGSLTLTSDTTIQIDFEK